MCKQLLVLSEGTVQQSKVRKVSSFDGGRQIIFTSPTIVKLEHALAKLDIVIWENVSTSGFSQFSLTWVQPQPQPPCRLLRKHSKHVVWTKILVSTIYHFIIEYEVIYVKARIRDQSWLEQYFEFILSGCNIWKLWLQYNGLLSPTGIWHQNQIRDFLNFLKLANKARLISQQI